MNSQQTFLAIGAMIIMTMSVMTVNKNVLRSRAELQTAEYIIAANSIARGLTEEIRAKSFDERVRTGQTLTVSGLQPMSTSGSLQTISTSKLSVEDYNNTIKSVSTARTESFDLTTSVDYVPTDDLNRTVTSPTEAKRVMVKAYNHYLKDTVVIPYYKGLWR